MTPISVAIVDDEPLARQKLRLMLGDMKQFAVVGEAADGEGALRLIAASRPQLVGLDIQLPGLSGLDVLRAAEPRPEVIFTTAFDQYAVTAFELAAVDYVLKPFSRDRFRVALQRAIARFINPSGAPPAERLREVTERQFVTRLFVRDRGTIRPLRVSAIHYLESSDDYVILHTSGERFELNLTLAGCESRLDPATFLRIHRRFIVNLDHVTAITPIDGARFSVAIRNGTVLQASRTRSRLLRQGNT